MKLIRNTTVNLLGNIIPAVVILPSLGFIARQIGIELFGIYTISIAVVGYAGIFDMGLTKAIVRDVAIFGNNESERRGIISTGSSVIFIFGVVACVLLYFFSDALVSLLNVSNEHKHEAIQSVKMLSFSVPIFLLNQSWLAIHEGMERFHLLTLQRIIGSVLLAVCPVLALNLYPTLFSAIVGLFASRVISTLVTFMFCNRDIIDAGLKINSDILRRLFKFGGWLSISNILSPIMMYFDRFVISNILGADKVAYYTAPSEVVNKAVLIPSALSRTIFPRLISENTAKKNSKTIRAAYLWLSVVCCGGAICGWFFVEFFIKVWLGVDYVTQSSPILKVMIVGFVFLSFSQVPFNLIQAKGKSNITAMIHLVEVIPYLLCLLYLTRNYGLIGAAFAWSMRLAFDCLILHVIAKKLNNA